MMYGGYASLCRDEVHYLLHVDISVILLTCSSARWQATFETNGCISDLKAAVKDSTGNSPCQSGLRSICWKVSMGYDLLTT